MPQLSNASSPRLRHGLHFAHLQLAPPLKLPVIVIAFDAGRSYTAEESVELQVPGNPHLLERVIDMLLASGRERGLDARRAEPGEFTARAFFNGRLSLTQAEGVAATIAARSDAELRAARQLLSGRLGDLARHLADDIAGALALVEAGIDFTDQDDVVAISPGDLRQRLRAIRDSIEQHLRHAVGAEQLQAIPWVVLAGAPNAGKSSLFNALLGRERAVVSAVSGTTRDVLAEPLSVQTLHGPAEVMLVDLAGLDEADQSTIGALMREAAGQALERAELVLRCAPVTSAEPAACHSSGMGSPSTELIVRTKADLDPAAAARGASDGSSIAVSAVSGAGLDELRSALAARLGEAAVSFAADAVALQPRHDAALRDAREALDEAETLLGGQIDDRQLLHPELSAAAMRAALDSLAAVAGEVTPDDVLGRIFASFCIGK